MKYEKTLELKNGKTLLIRNGTEADGSEMFELFMRTHAETDNLLSYPEENSLNAEQEAEFLKSKTESENEIELAAVVDGKIVGMAGFEAIGSKYKVKHRAEFGITVAEANWGMGIGRALTRACIECARAAGYAQLELSVVGDNSKAMALYESEGFTVFGRNPKGFNSKFTGWQELVEMRLEL